MSSSICQSCTAGCCRAFAVPITGADVLRLERSTGLDFWDFACRWEDRLGQIAGEYVPRLFFDDEPLTPFTLCLLHQPSKVFAQTSRCRFLDEDRLPTGPARCSVYADRPLACQVFPLQWQRSSLVAVLEDVPAFGRAGEESEAYRLCPRPWESHDVDALTAPQQLAVAAFEAKYYQVVAAVWNQNPGSWLRFPEFLRLAYARRVVKRTERGLEADFPDSIPLPFVSSARQAA